MSPAARDNLVAPSASGKAAGITEPEPGQGLRLKPIVADPNAGHYFLPEPPTDDMSIWGSKIAVTRGALALSVITYTSYAASSLVLFAVGLVSYILLFQYLRSLQASAGPLGEPKQQQRVCVVGGGLSGVVSLKELVAAGHDAVVLEAADDFGGGFHGAYDSCHLTVSNHWMAFSDMPAPEANRVFWSAQQYVDYLHQYVEHFGLCSRVKCSTKVISVARAEEPSAPMGYTYTVTSLDTSTNTQHTEQYDAVVVCTGNNHSKKTPDFEGQAEFEACGGRVVHTADYKEPSPYAGLNVVCVGMGESGADVVKEVADVAKSCFLSLRRGVSVATKYPMRSVHTNDGFHAPMQYYAHPALNNKLFHGLNQKIIGMEGIDPAFSMIGKLNIEAGGGSYQFITKNETFVESLCTGKCLKVPGVAKLTAGGVQLLDGTHIQCDVVLCNTGYKRDWSMLRSILGEGIEFNNTRDLYKHMVHPQYGPSLSFVGWLRPAEGGVPAISEMQARYLSLVLSGQRELPSDWKRQAQVDKARDAQRFFLTPHMDALVHYPIMMEELARLIGCKLNMFRLFFSDNSLWKKMWFGAQQCSVYRFTGPGAAPEVAKELVERLPVAWFTNERATGMAAKLFAANALSFVGTPFGVFESSW